MGSPETLHIAIIGGGIGGLALAVALSKSPYHSSIMVDIYEAAAEIAEIGAGIAMLPRTWEIMKILGLSTDLTGHLAHTPNTEPSVVFKFRKSDQCEGVAIKDLVMNGGMMTFHRADVQRVFMKHLGPNCRVHLSRRLVSFTESENKIHLNFGDNFRASCDLIVGADGVNSAVRKSLLKSLSSVSEDLKASIEPSWSGIVVYRGLVSAELLAQHLPDHRALKNAMMYCGKNKHLVVYPVSQGRLINVAAFSSQPGGEGTVFPGATVTDVSNEELMSTYNGWEDEVQALLKCIEKPSRWAVHALSPLKIYASGRVALVGDAAHAMTPHQGSGAGQAIEDSYILSSVIIGALHTKAPITRTTEVYSSIRQPFGNGVLAASRNQGMLYQMTAPGFEHIRECDSTVPFSRLSDIVAKVAEGWKWAWTTSIEGDRKRALAML